MDISLPITCSSTYGMQSNYASDYEVSEVENDFLIIYISNSKVKCIVRYFVFFIDHVEFKLKRD